MSPTKLRLGTALIAQIASGDNVVSNFDFSIPSIVVFDEAFVIVIDGPAPCFLLTAPPLNQI